jgi:choline dehydrogenase-like flavoprotein
MYTVDYIIVGGGTAGCVLAERLSASGHYSVLVVEAGSKPRSPWIPIPAGFAKLLVNHRYNYRFESTPERTTQDRHIAIPRGRGLGGSSLINGMIYVRGQPADFDRWAESGAQGWDWASVEPYFRRFEHCAFEASGRGVEGPMHIERVEERCDISEAVMRAAGEADYDINPDYNGAQQDGFGYYQVLQRNRRRWSAYDAYLKPALQRSNLQVVTNTTVDRLFLENGVCAGVSWQKGDRTEYVRAQREVVLCAGSVHNPAILERSGIGQVHRVRDLGVEPVHASYGVGENYQDHYAIRMNWRVRNTLTINERSRGFRLIGEVARYLTHRRGILSLGTGLVHGFVRSQYAKDGPDIQYFVVDASYANAAERVLDRAPGMTVGVTQLQPDSVGSIHASSARPEAAPNIRPNFLSAGNDAASLAEGIRLARQVISQPSLRPYVDHEMNPGTDLCEDDALIDWARKTGQTIYHPVGTCSMGTGRHAVVDSRLRFNGLRGLRVADASVMPNMVSGNTQGAVMMIAEKASDLVLEDAIAGKPMASMADRVEGHEHRRP